MSVLRNGQDICLHRLELISSENGRMFVDLVTTNLALCAVLADDLNEITDVSARVIDFRSIGIDRRVVVDDVVIVSEAAVRSWSLRRSNIQVGPNAVRLVGSLGAFWESVGVAHTPDFDGYVDFKLPTLQIVNEIRELRSKIREPKSTNVRCLDPSRSFVGSTKEFDQIDRRILAYVTMGLSDRDISAKIFLSPQTVRNRVSRLLQRFGVHNRTQLAMMCVQDSSVLTGNTTAPVSPPLSAKIR